MFIILVFIESSGVCSLVSVENLLARIRSLLLIALGNFIFPLVVPCASIAISHQTHFVPTTPFIVSL